MITVYVTSMFKDGGTHACHNLLKLCLRFLIAVADYLTRRARSGLYWLTDWGDTQDRIFKSKTKQRSRRGKASSEESWHVWVWHVWVVSEALTAVQMHTMCVGDSLEAQVGSGDRAQWSERLLSMCETPDVCRLWDGVDKLRSGEHRRTSSAPSCNVEALPKSFFSSEYIRSQ